MDKETNLKRAADEGIDRFGVARDAGLLVPDELIAESAEAARDRREEYKDCGPKCYRLGRHTGGPRCKLHGKTAIPIDEGTRELTPGEVDVINWRLAQECANAESHGSDTEGLGKKRWCGTCPWTDELQERMQPGFSDSPEGDPDYLSQLPIGAVSSSTFGERAYQERHGVIGVVDEDEDDYHCPCLENGKCSSSHGDPQTVEAVDEAPRRTEALGSKRKARPGEDEAPRRTEAFRDPAGQIWLARDGELFYVGDGVAPEVDPNTGSYMHPLHTESEWDEIYGEKWRKARMTEQTDTEKADAADYYDAAPLDPVAALFGFIPRHAAYHQEIIWEVWSWTSKNGAYVVRRNIPLKTPTGTAPEINWEFCSADRKSQVKGHFAELNQDTFQALAAMLQALGSHRSY